MSDPLREWTLGVRMCRWDLLRRRYGKAKRERRGQRRTWLELRDHVCLMLSERL